MLASRLHCSTVALSTPQEGFIHLKTGWAQDAWPQWSRENWYFYLDISRWSWVTMLALSLDCSTTAEPTTPQKVLSIRKLVELKMLCFNDQMRTGISISRWLWVTKLASRLHCSTVALSTHQKVLSIRKLVELKMLDFSDHIRTGVPIMTSAADWLIHSILCAISLCPVETWVSLIAY